MCIPKHLFFSNMNLFGQNVYIGIRILSVNEFSEYLQY